MAGSGEHSEPRGGYQLILFILATPCRHDVTTSPAKGGGHFKMHNFFAGADKGGGNFKMYNFFQKKFVITAFAGMTRESAGVTKRESAEFWYR